MTAKKDETLNIYRRKNAVMKAVSYIQKDGQIEFGKTKYKAVTHDAVMGMIRPHLVEHGIDMGVSVTNWELRGKLTIAEIDLILTNIDVPDEQIKYHGFAYGMNDDKGPGAAISYATKNIILKCFGIETGENDESRFHIETEIELPKVDESDLTVQRALILGSESLDELQCEWQSMSKEMRENLQAEKDEAKARLINRAA